MTHWFRHDCTAHLDQKIMKIRSKFGNDGYGSFWIIMECLYNNDGYMDEDVMKWNCERNGIDKGLLDYCVEIGLLQLNIGEYSSIRLNEEIEFRKEKSEKAKEIANRRWGKEKSEKGDRFYVIRCFDNNEEFIKCGITGTSINRRFSGKIPYDYEILLEKFCSVEESIDLENEINEKHENYLPKNKFGGHFECYNIKHKNSILSIASRIPTQSVATATTYQPTIPTNTTTVVFEKSLSRWLTQQGKGKGYEFWLKEEYGEIVNKAWKKVLSGRTVKSPGDFVELCKSIQKD